MTMDYIVVEVVQLMPTYHTLMHSSQGMPPRSRVSGGAKDMFS